MNLTKFDIYWIHNVEGESKWIEELAKYFQGKKPEEIPLIGVSNHNLSEIKQAIVKKIILDFSLIWFWNKELYLENMTPKI